MNYNKAAIVALSICIVAIAFTIFILGTYTSDSNQYEIDDKNYHALLLKYEYLKGSEAGEAFAEKLKLYLEDGIVTEKEYKSLTGKKSEKAISYSPEYVALYEQSKKKLKEL